MNINEVLDGFSNSQFCQNLRDSKPPKTETILGKINLSQAQSLFDRFQVVEQAQIDLDSDDMITQIQKLKDAGLDDYHAVEAFQMATAMKIAADETQTDEMRNIALMRVMGSHANIMPETILALSQYETGNLSAARQDEMSEQMMAEVELAADLISEDKHRDNRDYQLSRYAEGRAEIISKALA